MLVTKDALARRLAKKTGYNLQDVKKVVSAMDDVIKDCYSEVTDEDEVLIQICEGVKIGCSIIPERQRKNPKTKEEITIPASKVPGFKAGRGLKDAVK